MKTGHWAAAFAATTLLARPVRADDVLHVGTLNVDPPTLTALGVQLLVTGDDNMNAAVTVRYRAGASAPWRDGLPLFRVHPDVVMGRTVPAQFAGSILDLLPGTTYEIELHAVDADGAVDQTVSTMATTRVVPRTDPASAQTKAVTDAASFSAALGAAQAGDVITLASGTYAGNFEIHASGTEDNPIVVRGQSEDGVILDGGGCTGCNVLEVYGSFVHVERMTIAHASRALRFQGQGAEGNVVRRVHVLDTVLGFGSNPDQKNFYICDNVLEGRLVWPAVYADDGGMHANDDGIHVEGTGHVICHNQLVGYGDAMKTEQVGARSIDFYGNEVLSAYDNGVELDGSEGNVRCLRNRFTNTYATISFQPIFGGPAYTVRNIVVNVANEQMKFHALGGMPPEEPSGVLVYHNTFVSPITALALHDDATSHYFAIENNLFVTAATQDGRTMDWTGTIDQGTFDYDGYFPDGVFDFHFGASGYQKFTSFADARTAQPSFEPHGVVLTSAIFASGLVAPADYKTPMMPPDVALAMQSNAVDRGLVLANINDGYTGAGPDLGALELGCASPIYGVRPEGVDETNEPLGCGSPQDAGTGTDGAAGSAGSGGASGVGGAGAGGGAVEGGAGTGTGGAGASGAAGASSGGASGNIGNDAGPSSGDTAGSDGGCGCRTARSQSRLPMATCVALLAAAFARRGRVKERKKTKRAATGRRGGR